MALRFQAPRAFFESEFLPPLCVITGQADSVRPARVLFAWQPPWQIRRRSRWVTFTTPTPAQAARLGLMLNLFLKTGVGSLAGLMSAPTSGWVQLFFLTGTIFGLAFHWGFERLSMGFGRGRMRGLTFPVATQGRRWRLALAADLCAWVLYNSSQYLVVYCILGMVFPPGWQLGVASTAVGFTQLQWIGLGVAVFLGLVGLGLHLLPLVFFFPRVQYDSRSDLVTIHFRQSARPLFDAYLAARDTWVAAGGDRQDEADADDEDEAADEDENADYRRGW